MRIDIMTLFPEMCESVLSESIIGRARKNGYVEINCVNIRDFTLDKHNRVDDAPYGGGMGMLMGPQPIYDCYKSLYGADEKTAPYIYVAAGQNFDAAESKGTCPYRPDCAALRSL